MRLFEIMSPAKRVAIAALLASSILATGCAEHDEATDSATGAIQGSPADQAYAQVEQAYGAAKAADFAPVDGATLKDEAVSAFNRVGFCSGADAKAYRWKSKPLGATFYTVHLVRRDSKSTTLTGIFDAKGVFITSFYIEDYADGPAWVTTRDRSTFDMNLRYCGNV